uniref:Uncharacterized protein n=1 Tax=Pundamilia nyererei TaxID=303518 RepID=A0A3B4H6T5_9CICH
VSVLLQDLSVFTMPFLDGDPGRGEPVCHSASPTRSFFHRSPFSRPSSPRSAPARTSSSKTSPSSPKTIFPYQPGPPLLDSPPRSPRRLSFSGIFRSASRDSNHQPSSSPVSIKLFSRNKRDKARSTVGRSDPVGPLDYSKQNTAQWFIDPPPHEGTSCCSSAPPPVAGTHSLTAAGSLVVSGVCAGAALRRSGLGQHGVCRSVQSCRRRRGGLVRSGLCGINQS